MKKPKISLDKDKLQQFFLLHIEKMLLIIVVGLMLLLDVTNPAAKVLITAGEFAAVG